MVERAVGLRAVIALLALLPGIATAVDPGTRVSLRVDLKLADLHPAVMRGALECGAVAQSSDWVAAHAPMLADYDAASRWVLAPAHYAGNYAVLEFAVTARGYAGSVTFTTSIAARALIDPATHAPFSPGPSVLVACWLRLNGQPAVRDPGSGLQLTSATNFTGVTTLPGVAASAPTETAVALTAQLTANGDYFSPAAVTINFGSPGGMGLVAGGATPPPASGLTRFAGVATPQVAAGLPGQSSPPIAPAIGISPPAVGVQVPPVASTAPPPAGSKAVTPVPAIAGLAVTAQTPVNYVVQWPCATGELPCSQPGMDAGGNPMVDPSLAPTYGYDLTVKVPGSNAFAPPSPAAPYSVQFVCTDLDPLINGCYGWANTLAFSYNAYVAPQTVFRVTRSDPTGAHTGAYADFTVTAPAQPQEPTGLTATEPQFGQVALAWQAVPNANGYLLYEKGSTAPAANLTSAGTTLNGVAAGTHTYQVATRYAASIPTQTLPEASVTVHAVPPARSVPFLVKSAGAGSAVASTQHLAVNNVRAGESLQAIALAAGFMTGWDNNGNTTFVSVPLMAAFADVTDLGFKRQVICWQWPNRIGALQVGNVTACTAGNHGNPPTGLPLDGVALANTHATPDSVGLIITSPTAGQLFVNLVHDTQSHSGIIDPGALGDGLWGLGWKAVLTTTLDGEGPKAVPNACLACHGGTFNAVTGTVAGASLLPIDPNLMVFANSAGQDRTAYEEEVRALNAAIANSGGAPAVASYINGLYGGAVATPGTKALANYVPQAWSQQAQLFQAVVRPSCLGCHLATPAAVTFDSAARFIQNKAAIYADVCVAHSMPHAQMPYQDFWTSTGSLGSTSVNLAGFMLGVLGYTGCP